MFDNRVSNIAILALIATYVAARLWRLTDSCLWFDEIFSVHAAEQPWDSIFWFVAQDLIHPPLFYALLKIWIAIGGESLLWLRLFPVLFSAAALVPFLLLCRELKQNTWTIAIALFLLVTNGSFIKYAQLVRMYSLLMCLSLFSIWLFVRYFSRGKNLIALVIINFLLVYTHYYGWLVVGSEIAATLIFQRFKLRGVAVMFGVVFASFLPWIYVIFRASKGGSELSQNISWIKRPGLLEIGTFAVDLVEPFYFQVSNAEPGSVYRVSVPILLIILAATVHFLANFRREYANENQTVYFIAIFAILPIIAVFLASWVLPHSIWGTRHLIIVAAPLTLLFSIVLTGIRQINFRIAAVSLVILFSIYAFYLQAGRTTPVYVWCAWEGVAEEIRSRAPENEQVKIYTFENLVAYHMWFALRDSDRFQVSVVKGVEGMLEDESYFLPRGFDGVQKAELKDITDDNVWLLFRTHRVGEENPLLESLKIQGYSPCALTPGRYGTTNVFKVEMTKTPRKCAAPY